MKRLRVNDGAAVGERCPGAGQGTKASMCVCVYDVYNDKQLLLKMISENEWAKKDNKQSEKQKCHNVTVQAQLFLKATLTSADVTGVGFDTELHSMTSHCGVSVARM